MPETGDVLSPGELSYRLARGEESALHLIFRRWSPLVYSVAQGWLRSAAEAEDITQQVFVAAWNSRHTLQPGEAALPAWLLGICRNKLRDALSARSRSIRLEEAARGSVVPPTAGMDAVIDRLVIEQTIAAMGSDRAEVLRRVLLAEQTQQSVADELALPLGTVKSHVRRGLAAIRSALEEVDDAAQG